MTRDELEQKAIEKIPMLPDGELIKIIGKVTKSDKKLLIKARIEKTRQSFMNDCGMFVGQYDKEMVRAFFDYWTELNTPRTKMRFEMEKTWETSKRLATWNKNQSKFNGRNSITQKSGVSEDYQRSILERLYGNGGSKSM